jgi:hypothetical protein
VTVAGARPAHRDAPGGGAMTVSAAVATARSRCARHGPGVGLLVAVTIWTMRRFIFTGGIPAGTDMLGFVSRSAQYASFGQILDAWSLSSFGARRVFNFDNILGALTLLLRNPMTTVRLLDVLTMLGAGVAAYALAWAWYKSRLAAASTGLLYMLSQASLTHWGSGMLNVEIIIALGPVMLLTWSSCLRRFTPGRAVGFTFAVGIGLLVRADQVLYVAPFLVLYAAAVLTTRDRLRAGLANAVRTLAVAVPGVLLLNAAWLVPSLAGYRAQYETLSQFFSLGALSTRSLGLYPSLLGFGREIGYFGFTGTETWYSYPGLPLWAYYALASLVPVLAYLALRWHRDRRTVFLALASVLATLAAPGSRPPLGGLYLWAAQHIPIVGNLRDPNRWLIVQAIAYALLASLTIDRAARAASSTLPRRHQRRGPTRLRGPVVSGAVACSLLGIGLVPVLPTLVIGLRTWHVTRPQQALLSLVRDAPSADRVASIPFDQDYRYLVQGSYQGYEHDLGYESALFTGRQDIGDGSWNQRSASFVAYEASLLTRRDPAFVSMLASAGVSRLMSFHYPLVAPQIVSNTVGPYTQQHDAAGLPGLTPLLTNPAGTDYKIAGAASPLSLRRNIAVILGGSQGVSALADRPGLTLSDWAVFTAGDVIATRGYPALLALMRRADIVLLADERPVDIAVQGTTSIAELTGITSDPQVDRLETDVPTDQTEQTGSLDDPAVPIPQPGPTSSSSTFSVRSPRRVGIWARVLANPQAATIEASVDGARAGAITPVTLGTGGFEWLRVATVSLGPGTHHVTLSAVPSRFGDRYEVEESRVLDPGALRSAQEQLGRVLAGRAGRVAYSFNLADVAKWSWASLATRLDPAKALSFSPRAWTVPTEAGTAVTTTSAPDGVAAPQFTAQNGRPVYTVAKLRYRRPQDWAKKPYVYLEFKGSDSGNVYEVSFYFGRRLNDAARYVITDNSRGWRTLAFPTAHPGPGSGVTDWSRVRAVGIALPSKSESGTFALSVPQPSGPVASLRVPLPLQRGTRKFGAIVRKPDCIGGGRFRAPDWLAATKTLVVPVTSLNPSCSLYAASRAGYRQLPAAAVKLHRTGTESWSYSFSARQPGVLVWTQAYDPLWVLSGAGMRQAPVPVLALLDGYFAGPGRHAGTIAFTGGSSTLAGIAVTVLTVILLLLVPVFCRRRGRRRPAHSAVEPPGALRPVVPAARVATHIPRPAGTGWAVRHKDLPDPRW